MADSDEPVTNHQTEANSEDPQPQTTTIDNVVEVLNSYLHNEFTLGRVLSKIRELHIKFDTCHSRQSRAKQATVGTAGNERQNIINNNKYYYYGSSRPSVEQGKSAPPSHRSRNDGSDERQNIINNNCYYYGSSGPSVEHGESGPPSNQTRDERTTDMPNEPPTNRTTANVATANVATANEPPKEPPTNKRRAEDSTAGESKNVRVSLLDHGGLRIAAIEGLVPERRLLVPINIPHTFDGDVTLGWDGPIPGFRGRWEFLSRNGEGSAEAHAHLNLGGQAHGIPETNQPTAEQVNELGQRLRTENRHDITKDYELVWIIDGREASSHRATGGATQEMEDSQEHHESGNADGSNADVPNADAPDTNIPDADAPNADEPHTNVQMIEEPREHAERHNDDDEPGDGLDKGHTTEVVKNDSPASSANEEAENRLISPSHVEQDSPAQRGNVKRKNSVKPHWTMEKRELNLKTIGVNVNPEDNRGAILPSPPGGGRTLRKPVERGMTPVTVQNGRRDTIAKPCQNPCRRPTVHQDSNSAKIESTKNQKRKGGARKLSKVDEAGDELAESQPQRSGRIASSPSLSRPRVNPETRGRTPTKRTRHESLGMEETEDDRSSGYNSEMRGLNRKRHKSTPERPTPTRDRPQQEADEGDQEPEDVVSKARTKKPKRKGKGL